MSKEMVNTEEIKNLIYESCVTQSYLSRKLKITQPALSLKLNNKRKFRSDEKKKLIRILNIDNESIGRYFG